MPPYLVIVCLWFVGKELSEKKLSGLLGITS